MEEENTVVDEDRSYCVYVHTNKINGKKYVGQTKKQPPKKRWQNGFGYRNNDYFFKAIKKYGWDNFTHEIVEDKLTKEEADNLETLLIKNFDTMNKNNGYNLKGGGSKGEISDETRKKLSVISKGRIMTEEHKRKIGKSNSGKNFSKEHRRRLSESAKGREISEEHRRKISESLKGIKKSKDTIDKMRLAHGKNIIQYTKDGTIISQWRSSVEAYRETGIQSANILKCCRGERRFAGGCIWRFASEPLTKEHFEWCNTHGNKKQAINN